MRVTGVALALAVLTLAGCDDPEVKTGAAKVAIGAKVAADGASDLAKKGAEKTSEATRQTVMTGRVLGALKSADGLDSSNIDVDTIKDKVYLEGSVPTAENKQKAERIASDIAGSDYKVVNNLTIRS